MGKIPTVQNQYKEGREETHQGPSLSGLKTGDVRHYCPLSGWHGEADIVHAVYTEPRG
jgi:hypothetical protein